MKIGVFDSGKGGEFIADGLQKLLPHHDYIVINDRKHAPYGSRTNDEIIELTDTALQPLYGACPIIIVACNTATMAAITELRARHPNTLFIGTEPMIAPADRLSATRRVTVLATPLTLASQRYQLLKESYGASLIIDEPNTKHWAALIEQGHLEKIDTSAISASVLNGSDTIILACTHYIALKNQFEATYGNVTILEPTSAIAQQVERLVEKIQLHAGTDQYGSAVSLKTDAY